MPFGNGRPGPGRARARSRTAIRRPTSRAGGSTMQRFPVAWQGLAVVFLGWLAQPLAAQNAFVLHLDREGSATVILAEKDRVAFISDGGRSQGGITDAAVNRDRVLELLRKHHIKTLVVTCSHPHADHLDGLVALLTDPAL